MSKNSIKTIGIGAVALIAIAAFAGGKAASGETKEPVTVVNNSVTGNITNSLLAESQEKLLSTNKTVLKVSADKNRVLYLNDVVEYQSVKTLVDKMKTLEKQSSAPIWLMLDSPGGSVLDGATLISQMETSKAPVYTVCTRLCASMAALIHSFGTKRYMLDRAILMYHPASGGASGQINNAHSLLTTVKRYVNKFNANIINRSGIDKDKFERLVAYELWIDAEDANNEHMNDSLVSLDVPNSQASSDAQSEEQRKQRITTYPVTSFNLIAPQDIRYLWIK